MDIKLVKYIEQEVDLHDLIDTLDFSDEDIESAATQQPGLFLEAARFRVQKMRQRAQAEFRLDLAAANRAVQLREIKSEDGKKVFTEPAIKERVMKTKKVRIIRRKMERAFEAEEFGKLLVEAFRQRKDAIKIVMDSRLAEVGGDIKAARDESNKKLRKKLQREVRERARRSGMIDDEESY